MTLNKHEKEKCNTPPKQTWRNAINDFRNVTKTTANRMA